MYVRMARGSSSPHRVLASACAAWSSCYRARRLRRLRPHVTTRRRPARGRGDGRSRGGRRGGDPRAPRARRPGSTRAWPSSPFDFCADRWRSIATMRARATSHASRCRASRSMCRWCRASAIPHVENFGTLRASGRNARRIEPNDFDAADLRSLPVGRAPGRVVDGARRAASRTTTTPRRVRVRGGSARHRARDRARLSRRDRERSPRAARRARVTPPRPRRPTRILPGCVHAGPIATRRSAAS